MKFLFPILLFVITSNDILLAQGSAEIKGRIQDEKSEPALAATVALLVASDSSLSKVAVTDEHGEFSFQNVRAENYLLKVSMVGYDTYYSGSISVLNTNIQLPAITLIQSGVSLQGVTVTAQKPLIEVKADKTVFNVENSINAAGSTAYELLQRNLPALWSTRMTIFF
jgi:hypothetical protein